LTSRTYDAQTGLKKISLPLNLADTLAYLFKAGIPIKRHSI